MRLEHQFGGHWTEEKLSRLGKYLKAFTTIFTRNPRASKLTTMYVDAFAGTGYRSSAKAEKSTPVLFETEPPFDQYLFIDETPEHAHELESLRQHFPAKAQRISVIQKEANSFLAR